jgi:hypothetical protein
MLTYAEDGTRRPALGRHGTREKGDDGVGRRSSRLRKATDAVISSGELA